MFLTKLELFELETSELEPSEPVPHHVAAPASAAPNFAVPLASLRLQPWLRSFMHDLNRLKKEIEKIFKVSRLPNT
jgi:hypothetical protein